MLKSQHFLALLYIPFYFQLLSTLPLEENYAKDLLMP